MMTTTTTAKATIVVVPRDHFSDACESLDSIFAYTPGPFELVYVDAGSPASLSRYIERQAAMRGFKLLKGDGSLTPNQARNLGARGVATPYLVFVDNDVVFAPDWLELLIDSADQTGAAIVGPLVYEGRPVHTQVHFAGGEARIETSMANAREERHLVDRIFKDVPQSRQITGSAEFHCMLVRTEMFHRVGGLDERMLSTRENLDFCMAVKAAGGAIYIEPRSKVTYLPPAPLRLRDVPYFALRWADERDLSSFRQLRDNWRLIEDAYFAREYRNVGWRRQAMMMRGCLLRWIPSWRLRSRVERVLRPLERRINRRIARGIGRARTPGPSTQRRTTGA